MTKIDIETLKAIVKDADGKAIKWEELDDTQETCKYDPHAIIQWGKADTLDNAGRIRALTRIIMTLLKERKNGQNVHRMQRTGRRCCSC